MALPRVFEACFTSLLSLLLLSAPLAAATAARLSPAQEQRLREIFKVSEKAEQAGDGVKAYLTLKEAQRLEQLWTSNVLGDDALAARHMNSFVTRIIRRDDATVMHILHSKQITLGDKLGLLHVLEQDVLVNYPGQPSNGLLQGYDE